MPFEKLVEECIRQLETMDNYRILNGLGEFITPNHKDFAKAKLREETIALLKLRA